MQYQDTKISFHASYFSPYKTVKKTGLKCVISHTILSFQAIKVISLVIQFKNKKFSSFFKQLRHILEKFTQAEMNGFGLGAWGNIFVNLFLDSSFKFDTGHINAADNFKLVNTNM